jgi:hypothetical protein
VTLTEFLAVRLDEAERGAKATARRYGPAWSASGGSLYDESNPSVHPGPFATGVWGDLDDEVAEHIARHDPDRELRRVAGDRQIVALHEPARVWTGSSYADGKCSTCLISESDLYGNEYETVPCPTLRALAVPYADHEDYQPEWRPETAAP